MLDLVIRNGVVIDGTGARRRHADLGILHGRIVEMGTVTADAAQVVDAGGHIVSPGFIDIHTHYDAQVFWDPDLTPSSLHGVTTVVLGNCGLTLAPIADDNFEYTLRMLSRVEGMPIVSLRAGVPWGRGTRSPSTSRRFAIGSPSMLPCSSVIAPCASR